FSFMPQGELFTNAATAWQRANLGNALLNSMIMATLVTIGKVALSACTAFAIVFFRSPLKHFFFWTVFITLMLPLEVRVVPTYSVAADL
ncbi:ABC transporter permease, partial [Burkholderia sp. SIMBA_013]